MLSGNSVCFHRIMLICYPSHSADLAPGQTYFYRVFGTPDHHGRGNSISAPAMPSQLYNFTVSIYVPWFVHSETTMTQQTIKLHLMLCMPHSLNPLVHSVAILGCQAAKDKVEHVCALF